MPRPIVIGVDAGGTKTIVMIGAVTGGQVRPLGRAVGPPGNPRSVGFQAALQSLQHTISHALVSSELDPTTKAACACLSVAGAGRPEEQQRIVQWCQQHDVAGDVLVVGDAECLLAAAGVADDAGGIALIAGTGSMAWGRSATGQTSRAGGFGFLFDDEGSAYWIATEALRQICKAADARKGSTSLLTTVLAHLRLDSPQELIPWCYGADDQRVRIASLAPLVFEQFHHDEVASSIIQAGARELAGLVDAVASDLEISAAGFTLACAGSVLLKQPMYRELLTAELTRLHAAPGSICVVQEPAVGALQIAGQRVLN